MACLKEFIINPYTGICFLGCQIWVYETGVLIRAAQGYSTVFTVPVTLTVIQGQRIYLHFVFLCFVLLILPTRKTVAFISIYITRKPHYTEKKTTLLHYPGRLHCAPVCVWAKCADLTFVHLQTELLRRIFLGATDILLLLIPTTQFSFIHCFWYEHFKTNGDQRKDFHMRLTGVGTSISWL